MFKAISNFFNFVGAAIVDTYNVIVGNAAYMVRHVAISLTIATMVVAVFGTLTLATFLNMTAIVLTTTLITTFVAMVIVRLFVAQIGQVLSIEL